MKILDHLCKLECIRAIEFVNEKWCIGGVWGLLVYVKFSIIWVHQRNCWYTQGEIKNDELKFTWSYRG